MKDEYDISYHRKGARIRLRVSNDLLFRFLVGVAAIYFVGEFVWWALQQESKYEDELRTKMQRDATEETPPQYEVTPL